VTRQGAAALVAVWAAVVLLHLEGVTAGWAELIRHLMGLRWDDVRAASPARLVVNHGLTALSAVVLAAVFLRLGRVIVSWAAGAGAEGPQRWEREALAALFGFAGLGTAFFGLGLDALFFRPVLMGTAALAVICPGAMPDWRLPAMFRRPPGWWLVALAPAGLVGALAFMPTVHVDVYSYHLVAPELFLRLHRFTLENVTMGLHCPLTAEVVYAFGVMADRDALPQLLQLVPFAGAVALLLGWASRAGGPAAGRIVLVLVLTLGVTEQQMVLAKNSLAGAAYPVAGAVCLLRAFESRRSARWLKLSAICFGCGMAVKWNGVPLAALGALAAGAGSWRRSGRGARPALRWGAVAAMVTAPWLVKSWLWTGDPVWPILAPRLPGALWEPESTRALAAVRAAPAALAAAAGLPAALASFWAEHHPVVLLAAPCLLLAGAASMRPVRSLATWSAAGWVLLWYLFPGDASRLALPVWLLLAAAFGVLAAGAAETVRGVPGRAMPWAFALAAWLPLGSALMANLDPALVVRYMTGALDQAEYRSAALGTYPKAAAALSAEPGVRGVIVLGDDRFYRLPGRPLGGRFYGRTWAWATARECPTRERIRVRMRQVNATHVLYNFVSDQFPHAYTAAYVWEDRALNLWTDFLRRDLAVAVPASHVDHSGGGFCIYRVRPVPLARPAGWLPYLPGAPGLFYQVNRFANSRDLLLHRAAALDLNARCPGVDAILDLVATGYRHEQRWGPAWRYYAPGIAHGTVNDDNVFEAGVAAAMLGRETQAFRLLTRAVEISPYLKPDADRALRAISAAVGAMEPTRPHR